MRLSDADGTAASDLSSLTPSERRVLRLLAAGHTVKSIAVELDVSVNTVNERLRQARRKTGASSSRDLARYHAAQENCDKNIGLGTTDTAVATLPDAADIVVHSRRWQREIAVMFVVLAAGAALFSLGQSDGGSPVDRFARLAEPTQDTRSLYRQVRSEAVDPTWAGKATTRLINLYVSVPGIRTVKVTCATTLCEVAGEIEQGAAPATALRDAALAGRVRDLGFAAPGAFAIGSDGVDDAGRFLAYWPRRVTP